MTRNEEIKMLTEKLKDIRIAMLTTVSQDGVLYSRPMGTQAVDPEGVLWFFTQDPSPKIHAIEADQHINVAYSDEKSSVWVSVAGKATIVHDQAKINELWTPAMKAWFPEGKDDPKIALIRIDIESAQIWDSPGKVVELIAFAKSIATGKTIDNDSYTKKIDLRH
ncbi:MAG: pyridoxamine 5'-phosphate oxidase family protein [Bdellovibrionota bacterium]